VTRTTAPWRCSASPLVRSTRTPVEEVAEEEEEEEEKEEEGEEKEEEEEDKEEEEEQAVQVPNPNIPNAPANRPRRRPRHRRRCGVLLTANLSDRLSVLARRVARVHLWPIFVFIF